MSSLLRVLSVVLLAAALAFHSLPATAQGEAKPADKPAAGDKPSEAAKEAPKPVDEFAEAARLVNGPAGNAECVWLGRRVVNLLTRDDLDTAFRHLDLYDRFGCPGPHIQSTFRCVVRQGGQGKIDTKAASESLNARVHTCWLNPSSSSQATAATPPAPGAAAAGATARAPGTAPK